MTHMMSIFITLIRFSYLSSSEYDSNSSLSVNTLKFCTGFNIKDVKTILIDEKTDKESRRKIVRCTKIFTDALSKNEDSNVPPALPNSNSYIYTIEFDKTGDKDDILVMRNEFKDPIFYVKISFCTNSLSGFKFEFVKSISDFDQTTKKPENLFYKEFKTLHSFDANIFILGESNLSLVKTLLDFEFYLVTQELKKDVLNPMIHFYKDIKESYKDTEKVHLISEKFNILFEKMKDAFVMKYNFQVSKNLEWTYLNSDNISLDEAEIFNSMQILVRDTLDKISDAIGDINLEIKKLEDSDYISDVFNDLIFFLTCSNKYFEKIIAINMNIQDEKLFKLTTKEDKINYCIEFLELDLERLDVNLEINKIACDFYLEFNKSKNQFEVFNNLYSKVCALNVQKNLIKKCLEYPTIINLTNYMNFRRLEIYKVKDLLTSWKNLHNSCKNLKSIIMSQNYSGKIYKKLKLRYYNVKNRNQKLLSRLNSYMTNSYCLSDLPLKSCLINFLLVNNDDVLKFMKLKKNSASN